MEPIRPQIDAYLLDWLTKGPLKREWFFEKFYREKLKPKLAELQVRVVQLGLAVSEPYALRIRSGACIPHQRHWEKLARLANIQIDEHILENDLERHLPTPVTNRVPESL